MCDWLFLIVQFFLGSGLLAYSYRSPAAEGDIFNVHNVHTGPASLSHLTEKSRRQIHYLMIKGDEVDQR